MKEALQAALGTRVEHAARVAGGASKEAWAVVTADGRELLVRRAEGGVIHTSTLSLRDEFEVLRAAHDAGVRVPAPIAYLGEVDGREAFAMELVHGETIGRRIVKSPPHSLASEMAQELAKIHAIPLERLPFLRDGDPFEVFYAELDSIEQPHPAIELGSPGARERIPLERPLVVGHGDFRAGQPRGLGRRPRRSPRLGVRAHVADPVEDVAWPLVRAWRFGRDDLRLGGIGDVEPYLARYAELTGRDVPLDELYAWEVLGNCKWAIGALRQGRRHLHGEDRSVEFAILGRLAAEMEYEILDLITRAA